MDDVHPQAPPDLVALVRDCRSLFERLLQHSNLPDTAGTCLFGATLLAHTLRRFTGFGVAIRGGDGEGDGGFQAPSGTWHGHYWVEALRARDNSSWTVDITADQFGGPPVAVLCSGAAPHYRPGDQELVDAHVESLGLAH